MSQVTDEKRESSVHCDAFLLSADSCVPAELSRLFSLNCVRTQRKSDLTTALILPLCAVYTRGSTDVGK